MKPTVRTIMWEHGPLFLIAGWLAVVMAWTVTAMGGPLWLAGVVGTPFLPPVLYWWHLCSKYPTKGDLPEWQEYIRAKRLPE